MPPAAPFRSILAQVEQHNDDDPKPGDPDVPSIFELPRCCAAWGRHSLGAAQPPASSLANEDGGHEREEDDADMDADAESPMATTSRTASCSPFLFSVLPFFCRSRTSSPSVSCCRLTPSWPGYAGASRAPRHQLC
ncbi:hypothetical protein PVAP13_7KG208000 [Panicum virgatum]|uniref:Uncharacterized protein n=1 Tax=Panicum virgatum TaxID=38727 RepID=A0A8T0QFQ8_PANVG|nr:hypothetical protein PVAP13_7KG208000 [Panicum virgatum]